MSSSKWLEWIAKLFDINVLMKDYTTNHAVDYLFEAPTKRQFDPKSDFTVHLK